MENDKPVGNQRTVFVVQVDNTKDMSDAKVYGRLRGVFGRPRKPYDTSALIAKARRTLAEWEPGDYLLMVGDPTLCAVCMTVAGENTNVINVLSWDREQFRYMPQRWDFAQLGFEFETAED